MEDIQISWASGRRPYESFPGGPARRASFILPFCRCYHKKKYCIFIQYKFCWFLLFMLTSCQRVLRHPERIHPSLWRASQLAHIRQATLATGHASLDAQLPGAGWPLGALTEWLLPGPGTGELQLLRPALDQLQPGHSIALVNPPDMPSASCWHTWHVAGNPVLWVQPSCLTDTLWSMERILQHNTCAAVLCWLDDAPAHAVRRLAVAARRSNMLCIALRPCRVAARPSPAALRIALARTSDGLALTILKRQGPAAAAPICLTLFSPARPRHDALDQSLPALA